VSEDNAFQPPVIAAAGLSIAISVMLIIAQLLGLDNPRPSSLLVLATLPFGMALGFYIVGRYIGGPRSTAARPYLDQPLTPPKPPGKKEQDSKFCKDCGQLFTMRQKQTGFDPATGKPRLSFELGCPDGDPTKTSPEYDSWLRYPAPLRGGPITDMFLWPNCGKTKVVPLTPVGHNHGQAETKTDCPKCIDEMLSAGIIDLPAARKLMSAIR
jgi:hypothetical protein